LGLSLCFTGPALAEKELAKTEPNSETPASSSQLPFESLKTLSEVYGRIKQDYVEPVKD
jgi:carboxyl-terminal processing protease